MVRFCLLLLLLLPYLAGVGAGVVGRPEPVGPTARHPYVHSLECQHRNYLRLDCFDTCNGDQSAVEAQDDSRDLAHVLAVFKSIDLHCLPAIVQVVAPAFGRVSLRYGRAAHPALACGVRPSWYQPPRRN